MIDHSDELLSETAGRAGNVGGKMSVCLFAEAEQFTNDAYLTASKRAVEIGDTERVKFLMEQYQSHVAEPDPGYYGTNGMPDVTANQMYYAATVSGTIDTIPEVPGLAVWRDGHIGVYVGNGEVVEARGTSSGVVKTKLAERHFTHWLQVPYINYD